MFGRLTAPGQSLSKLGDFRPVLAQRQEPLHQQLGPVDASLLDIRPHVLDRLAPDLTEHLAGPAILVLSEPGAAGNVDCLFNITLLQRLFGLGHGVLRLEPGRGQLLPDQVRTAIAGGGLFEDAPTDRQPAILDLPFRLCNPQGILLLCFLMADDGVADRRTKLGDLRQAAGQPLGLVAIH